MKHVMSCLGIVLGLVSGVTAWYLFDKIGCHVYGTIGMGGNCDGGCWPYFKITFPGGWCKECEKCKNGHQMDELCRCTDECPPGKYGANCDLHCPYRCRSCNRTTGACSLWCSPLCLDGACHLYTGYCRLNKTTLLAGGCGAYNRSHCEEYSRWPWL